VRGTRRDAELRTGLRVMIGGRGGDAAEARVGQDEVANIANSDRGVTVAAKSNVQGQTSSRCGRVQSQSAGKDSVSRRTSRVAEGGAMATRRFIKDTTLRRQRTQASCRAFAGVLSLGS